jgi:hypothetical protein
MDTLIAAASRMVGPNGRVISIDMAPQMLDEARAAAVAVGAPNIDFHLGYIESIPLPDAYADVIISNGVINLAPDKERVFRELHRVLKPEGRLQIGDIIVQKAVPESAKRNIDLWAGRIAGALLEAELIALLAECGFDEIEAPWRADVFRGAPQGQELGDVRNARRELPRTKESRAAASCRCNSRRGASRVTWRCNRTCFSIVANRSRIGHVEAISRCRCNIPAGTACIDPRRRTRFISRHEAVRRAMEFQHTGLSVRLADGRRRRCHPRFLFRHALRARSHDG